MTATTAATAARTTDTPLVIDGLQCGPYDRDVFQQLRAGRVTCATATVAFWEDAIETMDALAAWNDLLDANADLVLPARTVGDIERAHETGRTAILLGAQNASPLQGRLGFVRHFHAMGLRVMQLTYNNNTEFGGSCYEETDPGLTRFGREVVREMNAVGMLVDLSHSGERTRRDAIEHSALPVVLTHANPRSLYDHPRNADDATLKALAARDGVVGLATYGSLCGRYARTLDDWCAMVARTVELVGVRHVAIGTDLSPKAGAAEFAWMRKGRWTRSEQRGADLGSPPASATGTGEWLADASGLARVADGLVATGFTRDEAHAVVGGNWLRLYASVLKTGDGDGS
ncbi:dipeptidase [Streptomyces cacaoi]|uniref:Membrane dipeptidase n=1 Tax=Streptomyces cacaoi TaxID=1898 RepID=A0A4Y3QU41_STRCI|nr:membrane dipeptidase [Streptomyces cacaoi]NNG85103.1 peptidase M19 [Streptomyces cacaoi]GEB47918.1 membrane dipeptidase [Streptomyces cacaoi]